MREQGSLSFRLSSFILLLNIILGGCAIRFTPKGTYEFNLSTQTLTVTTGQGARLALQGATSQSNGSSFSVIEGVENGELVLDMSRGLAEYTARPGFVGQDSFVYRVTDPQGEITVVNVDITVSEKLDDYGFGYCDSNSTGVASLGNFDIYVQSHLTDADKFTLSVIPRNVTPGELVSVYLVNASVDPPTYKAVIPMETIFPNVEIGAELTKSDLTDYPMVVIKPAPYEFNEDVPAFNICALPLPSNFSESNRLDDYAYGYCDHNPSGGPTLGKYDVHIVPDLRNATEFSLILIPYEVTEGDLVNVYLVDTSATPPEYKVVIAGAVQQGVELGAKLTISDLTRYSAIAIKPASYSFLEDSHASNVCNLPLPPSILEQDPVEDYGFGFCDDNSAGAPTLGDYDVYVIPDEQDADKFTLTILPYQVIAGDQVTVYLVNASVSPPLGKPVIQWVAVFPGVELSAEVTRSDLGNYPLMVIKPATYGFNDDAPAFNICALPLPSSVSP